MKLRKTAEGWRVDGHMHGLPVEFLVCDEVEFPGWCSESGCLHMTARELCCVMTAPKGLHMAPNWRIYEARCPGHAQDLGELYRWEPSYSSSL